METIGKKDTLIVNNQKERYTVWRFKHLTFRRKKTLAEDFDCKQLKKETLDILTVNN